MLHFEKTWGRYKGKKRTQIQVLRAALENVHSAPARGQAEIGPGNCDITLLCHGSPPPFPLCPWTDFFPSFFFSFFPAGWKLTDRRSIEGVPAGRMKTSSELLIWPGIKRRSREDWKRAQGVHPASGHSETLWLQGSRFENDVMMCLLANRHFWQNTASRQSLFLPIEYLKPNYLTLTYKSTATQSTEPRTVGM